MQEDNWNIVSSANEPMAEPYETKLLTEAAGVKVTMTHLPNEEETGFSETRVEKVILNLANAPQGLDVENKNYGFHLTKSKWDPYSWVEHVDSGSVAELNGLRDGDCLLEVDGQDLLGLRVKDVATLIRSKVYGQNIVLRVWRIQTEDKKKNEGGLALEGPLPEVAKKLARAVSGTVRSLECPICLETARPPVSQCVHGHILCAECRSKTARCPVCRVRLGQGRCLLADNLDRVIRDTFQIKSNPNLISGQDTCSLRQRLFGKRSNKKQGGPASCTAAKDNNTLLTKAKQPLLARLLLGGLEKAASAENLSSVSKSSQNIHTDRSRHLFERLGFSDRIKSASTGQLAKDTKERTLSPNSACDVELFNNAESTLSVPQTPTWGGSTESVSNMQVTCPLLRSVSCKETVTRVTLLEHVNRIHKGPIIHFYGGNATIPYPFPFGHDAVYIMHYNEELFFVQFRGDTIWITSSGNNSWEWILLAQGNNGKELKLRRIVACLEDRQALLQQHIANLPQELELHTVHIQLLEHGACDRSDV